jgi:hypothetical protein
VVSPGPGEKGDWFVLYLINEMEPLLHLCRVLNQTYKVMPSIDLLLKGSFNEITTQNAHF